MSIGLGVLDTNLFVHAVFPRDPHYARCRAIYRALHDGWAEGWLDPFVVHELCYVLGRFRPQFPTRESIHQYVRTILLIEGVYTDDKPALLAALAGWATGGVAFVDAWLAGVAGRRGLPVCSVNVADFPGLDNTSLTSDL